MYVCKKGVAKKSKVRRKSYYYTVLISYNKHVCLLKGCSKICMSNSMFFPTQTENKKWFFGPDGYKWFSKEFDDLPQVHT